MDNKIFNINGCTFKQFSLALELLLMEEYNENIKKFNTKSIGKIGSGVKGYKFSYKKGLILYWQYDKDVTPIDEIIPDFKLGFKYLEKSLRLYKLALLDEKIKNRVNIPFNILVYSLWNWYNNFKEWDKLEIENWDYNLKHWDYNLKHDGSNIKGFRIYTESCGRLNDELYSIGAIKPVYLLYGK